MRRFARFRNVGVTSMLIALLVLAGGAVLGSGVGGRAASAAPEWQGGLVGAPPPVELTVSPSEPSIEANGSTPLSGTWGGGADNCSTTPVGWRWSIVPDTPGATLTPSDARSVTFTPLPSTAGRIEVELRSAAIVRCGSDERVQSGTAFANVTVIAPLWLGPLYVGPDPIAVGGSSNLSGEVELGTPPYLLNVTWGDGTGSSYTLVAPGPFSFAHAFPAGNFTPSITLRDANGLEVTATSPEPVYASATLAVGLVASSYNAEVGLPVNLTGEAEDLPSWFFPATSCGGSSSAAAERPLAAAPALYFSCTYTAPGPAQAQFSVTPGNTDLAPAQADLALSVAAPLQASGPTAPLSAAVASPVEVPITIQGGVAPYSLRWNGSGSSVAQGATLYRGGTALLPVTPVLPGPFGVLIRVTDALGARVTLASSLGTADAPLNLTATATTSVTTQGAKVTVLGLGTGGTPPYAWCVVPSLAGPNASAEIGNLSGPTGFVWSGLFPAEGSTNITVGVLDGGGDLMAGVLPVALVPPLGVTAALGPGGVGPAGPGVFLNITIDGGLAPFDVRVGSAGGSNWTSVVGTDGRFTWWLPANRTGSTAVFVEVSDGLGATWESNLTVPTATDPPGGVGSSTGPAPRASARPPTHAGRFSSGVGLTSAPPTLGSTSEGGTAVLTTVGLSALIVALAAVVAVLFRRRRQRPTEGTPGPDPRDVVRRILEPADGADRSTVELLAEEEGLSLGVVRETIDRLVAEGVVHADSGTDGEEVLSWRAVDSG